ncbi:MAG TPA: hypothetical protein VID73_11670 [Ktedonobacterales bacterium]|jgi:hypothetical protein
MARNDQVTPDREDMRKDLLAALAAARELGPEMDSSLADAHLRRHYGEQPQRAVQPRPRADVTPYFMNMLAPLMMALCVAALVGVLFLSHGFGFWFIWPLLFFGFGWRRGPWGRHHSRQYDRRWDRYGRRDDGHYPDDDPHYVRYDAPRPVTARPAGGELV